MYERNFIECTAISNVFLRKKKLFVCLSVCLFFFFVFFLKCRRTRLRSNDLVVTTNATTVNFADDEDADDHLAAFEREVEKNLLLIRSAEELRQEALQYKEERIVRVAKEAELVSKRQQLLLLQV